MTGRTPAPAPEPAAGAGARARSLGSRLGEGLVMTVTFLIFRLVMIRLGLFHG